MKKLRLTLFTLAVFSLICTLFITHSHAFDIEIDVSPNVLNIQSQSTIVTVHTDIAYSLVVGASVFLNGVAIDWWKSDDRGNFVAKFVSDEIKTLDGLIIGDYNTLTLTGYDTDGDAFIGTQDVMVRDNIPEGKE
ncbi:hypothetical protein [Desulfobacula sp.]|uniref:hypothetical protein n=1 Tax=Desulfobacula sp. TaxID=2593537 RepID=UPI002637D725|nr:hypothetical protein [Desulfobacula sp.]